MASAAEPTSRADGRVALVTGASRGIGRGIAVRLAAQGASVAIVARRLDAARGGSSLAGTAEEIRSLGRTALTLEIDLRDAEARAGLVPTVEAELGPLDVLVNNAASARFAPFREWEPHRLRTMQELNVWAPWDLATQAAASMVARRCGWILNMTSAAAEHPAGPPFHDTVSVMQGAAYGGTKAMLNRLTTAMAAELHGSGVAVNALAPLSAARTELVEEAVEHGRIAADRVEPLEATVEAALALCSGDPTELTGRIAVSLELLLELRRPVVDLHGRGRLVPGWQPDDLHARLVHHPRYAEMRRRPPSLENGTA